MRDDRFRRFPTRQNQVDSAATTPHNVSLPPCRPARHHANREIDPAALYSRDDRRETDETIAAPDRPCRGIHRDEKQSHATNRCPELLRDSPETRFATVRKRVSPPLCRALELHV